MAEYYYEIADMVLKLMGDEQHMPEECPQLLPFITEKKPHFWEYHFQMVDSLPEIEGDFELVAPGRRQRLVGECLYCYLGQVDESYRNAYMLLIHSGNQTDVYVQRSELIPRIS